MKIILISVAAGIGLIALALNTIRFLIGVRKHAKSAQTIEDNFKAIDTNLKCATFNVIVAIAFLVLAILIKIL